MAIRKYKKWFIQIVKLTSKICNLTQSNNFAKFSTLEIAELLISSGNAEDEIRDFVY